MSFMLSPGVQVTEKDFTSIVPAVSTSAGAFAGVFRWGPVMDPIQVSSENELVANYGAPNDETAQSFFTAANFLSYTTNLLLVRVSTEGQYNAVAEANEPTVIENRTDYELNFANEVNAVGPFAAKYPGSLGNSIKVSVADSNSYSTWVYKDAFDSAPADGELHVIVIDSDGKIAGDAGGVLEKFGYLSKSTEGRRADGSNSYYKHVLNNSSKWVWWMGHIPGTNWGVPPVGGFVDLDAAYTVTLSGGADDFDATDGDKINGFLLLANAEAYDIGLVALGKASSTVATAVINGVAEVRKDCLVFVSPEASDGEVLTGSGATVANAIVTYRNNLPSTSYAVMDSGFKYQYDRYNDVYRWVPLNGDVAGLCARTDLTDDPWFSPGGYTRGQIKNVVRLAYNPDQTGRDILYKAGVNPVVSFPGQGTVLYGDKTLLAKPSAFDRINVRRLFIVLEKAIATAAKYQLFEFNDRFTRAQFVAMVEPFLRGVQGRRGITDFRVKCDELNNTGEVVDSNRFVADIFIKPARSVNFISLNFVAARTSVSFEEIGG
jgi:phage tail sheath protein FI